MKEYLIIGLSIVIFLVARCVGCKRLDVLQANKQIIDRGLTDWENSHDTNCLIKLLPIVDSCIAFQDYCNRNDTLYIESYSYKDLKIRILNSLKRYDEALILISQLPDNFEYSTPFGKNYILKTTLIKKYHLSNNYKARDSIINELIEVMNYQIRANYNNYMPSDTIYYGRGLPLVDTMNFNALVDYYLICIIRGDDKKEMINKIKQTYLNNENKIECEAFINWINNTDAQRFYDM